MCELYLLISFKPWQDSIFELTIGVFANIHYIIYWTIYGASPSSSFAVLLCWVVDLAQEIVTFWGLSQLIYNSASVNGSCDCSYIPASFSFYSQWMIRGILYPWRILLHPCPFLHYQGYYRSPLGSICRVSIIQKYSGLATNKHIRRSLW